MMDHTNTLDILESFISSVETVSEESPSLSSTTAAPCVVDVSQSLQYFLTNKHHHDYQSITHVKVINELKASIESCGFLYLSGYDAPPVNNDPSFIDRLFELIDDYFSLPLTEKEKSISKDKARRGYSPSKSDNFASLLLNSDDTTTYENDTVEKFRIGPLQMPEGITKNIHFFPNNFEYLSIELQELLTIYYRSMELLSKYILSLIGEIYFNNPNYFDLLVDKHTSILTFNYFSNDDTSSSVRIAPHTDVSILTILRPNSNGLQIFNNNEWISVDYVPNTFIVNIGDYLQDLINVKSTIHRVVTDNNSGYRVSIAYFVSPNYDSIINDVTYDEWRRERIKKAVRMRK